jgi:hypothetical protein
MDHHKLYNGLAIMKCPLSSPREWVFENHSTDKYLQWGILLHMLFNLEEDEEIFEEADNIFITEKAYYYAQYLEDVPVEVILEREDLFKAEEGQQLTLPFLIKPKSSPSRLFYNII